MRSELSIGPAAKHLDVSVDTLRRYEDEGLIAPARTSGGHRRYRLDDLMRLKRGHTGKARRQPDQGLSGGPPARQRPVEATRRPAEFDESAFEDDVFAMPEDDVIAPVPRKAAIVPRPTAPDSWLVAMTARNDRAAEANHLAMVRNHGQSRIPYDASAATRSTVLEMLASYVTLSRFPQSIPLWEAFKAVEAKVGAVLEPFAKAAADAATVAAAAAARAAEATKAAVAAQLDQARLARHREALIARGDSRAVLATFRWDARDRREAQAEVHDVLTSEVEPEWTEQDADECVDDILAEWTDDPEDE